MPRETLTDPDSERRRAEGLRIAQARRQLGLRVGRDIKRAHLAKLLDVEPSTVLSWEEGEKAPSEGNRTKLSQLLGVTDHYLRYGVEPMALPEWTPPDVSELDKKKPKKVVAKRYPIRKVARPGTERRKTKGE